MYTADQVADLRQGDVLSGLQYYCLKGYDFPSNAPFDSMRTERKEYSLVILSNSCDVTSENETKPRRFVFAPLFCLNWGRFEDQFHRLDEPAELNRRRDDGTFGYVRFFHYEPHPEIPGDPDLGSVVDFSRLRQGDLDNELFLDHKVAELDEEAANLFQEKLMAFFGRQQPPGDN